MSLTSPRTRARPRASPARRTLQTVERDHRALVVGEARVAVEARRDVEGDHRLEGVAELREGVDGRAQEPARADPQQGVDGHERAVARAVDPVRDEATELAAIERP